MAKSENNTTQHPAQTDSQVPRKSNIMLIGMPGAGKSTVGIELSRVMNLDFLDTDGIIVFEQGEPLEQIIAKRGIDGFLAVENDVLSRVEVTNTVISPGGSSIYSEQAMKHLAEIAHVVYLQVSREELSRRLGDLKRRGVVLRKGTTMSLDDLIQERTPLYEQWAEYTVRAEGCDVQHVACEIARLVNNLA